MKLLYLILLVLIFDFVNTNSEWKKVYQHEKSVQQWDFDCADSLNCISLASPGATGSMYIKTTDGGYNWFVPFADSTIMIYNEQGQWIDTKSPKFKAARCIDFVTQYLVVVGHKEGQITISRDGGVSWDSINLNTQDFKIIKFTDSLSGIALTNNFIFLTTDGGESWNNITSNLNYSGSIFFQSAFIKDDFIYAGGFFSTDKGTTWTKSNPINNIHGMYGVHFIDSREGWCSGRRQLVPNQSQYADVILHTTNSGLDWETQLDTILYPQSGLTGGIYFANHYEGLAYGEGKIWRTTDGGKNWINFAFPWTEMDAFTKLVFPKGHTNKIIANEYLKGRIWMYEDPTSVNNYETNHSNYIIYPNPTSDFITISLGSFGACSNENNNVASPNASIEIYDVMGILVTQTPTSVFNSQTKVLDLPRIDISHLPAGVYFMKVGNRFEKFVKI